MIVHLPRHTIMKSFFLLVASASAALATPTILPRITPEALAKLQQTSPMAKLVQASASESAQVARPEGESIIKQSVILHDGKNWTLVPQGAVVFIPEALKSRVDVKPIGNLLTFNAFLTANRGWVTTSDVSFNQAAGTEPVDPERAAHWAKQDKVVVAIHQGGPISIRLSPTPALTKK